MRKPLNRELVASFDIIVSVHDNASDVIDQSVSVPNGKVAIKGVSLLLIHAFKYFFYRCRVVVDFPYVSLFEIR